MTQKRNKIISTVIVLCLCCTIGLTPNFIVIAETAQYYQTQIDKLKSETAGRNAAIEEARQKQKEYQTVLNEKRLEKLTLKSQKEEINAGILETKFNIIENENLIEKTKLEIKTLDLEILQNEKNIEEQKVKIADMIKVIYINDSKNVLEAFLLYDSLSEFFDQIKYTESVQNGLANLLNDYELQKEEQKITKEDLKQKGVDLEAQKIVLEDKKDDLLAEQQRLSVLIEQTQNQESKFTQIINAAIADEAAMQAEIKQIEKDLLDSSIKFKDAKKKEEMERILLEMGGKISNNSLSWPVPFNTVTTYFHDQDYSFKSVIGEHAAVDIRAKQGTQIKAPAAGYVAKIKDGGAKGYSYIMLIHANNIATVYGHVSGFNVDEEDYVKEGDVIGYSGGTPGTRGAGPFTTGPHLHFEVRENGLPVNPLEYLKIKQ